MRLEKPSSFLFVRWQAYQKYLLFMSSIFFKIFFFCDDKGLLKLALECRHLHLHCGVSREPCRYNTRAASQVPLSRLVVEFLSNTLGLHVVLTAYFDFPCPGIETLCTDRLWGRRSIINSLCSQFTFFDWITNIWKCYLSGFSTCSSSFFSSNKNNIN